MATRRTGIEKTGGAVALRVFADAPGENYPRIYYRTKI